MPLLIVILTASSSLLIGCGGSVQRTPPGTYQYVISGYDTATGTIHESGTVSIQVN